MLTTLNCVLEMGSSPSVLVQCKAEERDVGSAQSGSAMSFSTMPQCPQANHVERCGHGPSLENTRFFGLPQGQSKLPYGGFSKLVRRLRVGSRAGAPVAADV